VPPAPAVGAVAEPPLAALPAAPVVEDIPWYESIAFSAFADGYLGFDFNFPKSLGQARQNPIRAYDARSGFALNWVGLDVQKAPEPVGGTIALRFGPGAQKLADACIDSDVDPGTCDGSSSLGLAYVKQAFASWKPGGAGSAVQLDLGKFDTPYGAEVAESQYNINYTRGVLYWLGQPAYHTGLRVGIDASRNFNLKILAVNGWNRSVDNNLGKSLGLQGTLRLPKQSAPDEDMLTLSLGYLVGPEHADSAFIDCPAGQVFDAGAADGSGCSTSSDAQRPTSGYVDRGEANTKGLRHFLDLTLIALPTDALKLLFNASLGIDNARDPADEAEFKANTWYGFMAGARYSVAAPFGVAGRVEYYADPDGYTTGLGITGGKDLRYVTGTLSLDYSPAEQLMLVLDGRLDWASKKLFPKASHDEDVGTAVSATLGAVVTTN
jgi:hypothetical protein